MIGSFRSRDRPRWPLMWMSFTNLSVPSCRFSCVCFVSADFSTPPSFWRHQGALYMCCKLRTVKLFSCCTHCPLTLASPPCYTPLPLVALCKLLPHPPCFSIRACTLRAEFFTCCEDFFPRLLSPVVMRKEKKEHVLASLLCHYVKVYFNSLPSFLFMK